MNPKTTVPLLVTLAPIIAAAPAMIIGGAIGLGIVLIIKTVLDGNAEQPPDTTPAKPEADVSRKPAETPVFRQRPASPPPSVSVPSVSPVAVQPTFRPPVSVATAPTASIVPQPPPQPLAAPQPVAKKSLTRADLTAIFDNGRRTLTRTAAVAALKRLGFGKTAAYAALSPHGRFNAWLHYATDGIISWKN